MRTSRLERTRAMVAILLHAHFSIQGKARDGTARSPRAHLSIQESVRDGMAILLHAHFSIQGKARDGMARSPRAHLSIQESVRDGMASYSTVTVLARLRG